MKRPQPRRYAKTALQSSGVPIKDFPRPNTGYAAASAVDADGITWSYFYGVWKDLMVFATISGKAASLRKTGEWAWDAVRSISRTG